MFAPIAGSYATGAAAAVSITLAPTTAPTPGNTRFLFIWNHDVVAAFTPPAGWTQHPLSPLVVPNAGGAGVASGLMAFYYRVVQIGDATNVVVGAISNAVRAEVIEFPGVGALLTSDTLQRSGNSGPPVPNAIGSVVLAGDALVIGLGTWSNGGDPLWAFTTSVGTVINGRSVDDSHGPPAEWIYHSSVGPATVSPTLTLTNGAANGSAGIVMAFGAAAAGAPGLRGEPGGGIW